MAEIRLESGLLSSVSSIYLLILRSTLHVRRLQPSLFPFPARLFCSVVVEESPAGVDEYANPEGARACTVSRAGGPWT